MKYIFCRQKGIENLIPILEFFSLLDMHYKTATRTQSVVSNDSGHGSGNELDAKPSTPVKLRRHEKYGIVSDYYDALLLV